MPTLQSRLPTTILLPTNCHVSEKEKWKVPGLYVELDFKEVTSKKAALIDSHEQLRNKLGKTASISREREEVQSEHHKFLPVDLHDIQGLDVVFNLVEHAIFNLVELDSGLPTFIITECVLVYMEPDLSHMVVRWATEKFSQSVFVIYEYIHLEDAFGQQMMRNFEAQRCPLLGLNSTPSLESKQKVFTNLGWQNRNGSFLVLIIGQQAL